MSEKVTVTLDAEDWTGLVEAARVAAIEVGRRARAEGDPEYHYRLSEAEKHYHDLAGRVSALKPEVTA